MEPLEFVNTIEINRPVEEVFKFVTTVENMNGWLRPTTPMSSWLKFRAWEVTDKPFREGTLFWVDRMGLRVSRFQQNHSFETDSFYFRFPASMIFRGTHARLRFEPIPQGTRFTFNRYITLRRLPGPLRKRFAGLFHQQLQVALEKLKEMIERS